jgi:hypothetical protein
MCIHMLRTLKLLLPAIIPSWRFFDEVTPSPRIEFVLLNNAHDHPEDWREFRPRPQRLSIDEMLKRMVWNPRWNESLFLVSCAERITTDPTEHSRQEILKRIRAELVREGIDAQAAPCLQFRLVFMHRHGLQLQKEVMFISPVYSSGGNEAS